MLVLHGGVGGEQLGASLIDGDSGSETPEKLGHAMDAARDHGGGKMMRAGDDVGDDFGFLRIWDARLEHANDGRRAVADATQANGLADDRRILVQSVRPETVGENDDAGSIGPVVLRPDEATEHRTKPHHIEIRAADNSTLNRTRLAEADHGEAHGGEVAKLAQSFHTRAQVLYLGHGKGGVFVADAGSALPDVDQPVLAAIDQGLEQHSAHQRENGGVCADAERQGKHHGDRQPWSPNERISRNSQITNEGHVLPLLRAIMHHACQY